MNIQELELLMKELGQPAYRAVQIFEWLHQRLPNNPGEAFSFAAMDNLPKSLREDLEKHCYITQVEVAEKLTAKDGTIKYLLAFGSEDGEVHGDNKALGVRQVAAPTVGNTDRLVGAATCRPQTCNGDQLKITTNQLPKVHIESVLMEYVHGRSLCISTQAGCRMGCVFCATGQGGLIRNLTAGEMCMQVYTAGGARNIVLMGCGEPLDNFDQTMKFIELITHPKGAGIGQRHITLSTCGLVPQMQALVKRRMQITLAVSLHGPDDATRQALMPIAKSYPIKELLAACKEYTDTTHRRITFEYALTCGINDSPAQARALASRLKGMLCHVNLIPVNQVIPTGGTEQKLLKSLTGEIPPQILAPTKKREAMAFAAILQQAGIPATVRRTIGAEVNAACGQLRARKT